MIPKIIHYCWFGGNPKPKSVVKMIASWQKYCPDYQIMEWNESNFDINFSRYTQEAYQCRKWAFVSDVARLYALYNYGGIYFDTDVEVVKSFDSLLNNDLFLGFEGTKLIATSTIGAVAQHPIIENFLNEYKHLSFIDDAGNLDTTTNVERLTKLINSQYNVNWDSTEQQLGDIHIYPSVYFSPFDYINGKLTKSVSTYSIHWFSQSWIERSSFKHKLSQLYHRLFGIKLT